MHFLVVILLLFLINTDDVTLFHTHAQFLPDDSHFNDINALFRVLQSLLKYPLANYYALIIVDPSSYSFVSQEIILNSIQNYPVYLISPDEDQNQTIDNILLQPGYQNSLVVAALITGQYRDWFDDKSVPWSFESVLIINVNPLFPAKRVLETKLIQRSPNVALIEILTLGIGENTIGIFSSRPFSRDSNGERRYKYFLGIWNKRSFDTYDKIFPNRFPSFDGDTLHIATEEDDYPLVAKIDGILDGISIRILDAIGNQLNFTYTTTAHSPDLLWGEKVNGTWKGLLGAVFRGEKNITVNYFTITYERDQDFEYSFPYHFEGFGFAMLNPKPLPAWRSLLYPFNNQVWLSILITMLSIPLILYILSKKAISLEYKPSLLDSFMETFKDLIRQDHQSLPSSTSTRMFLLFWWFAAMIITVSYTGNLIAVLTIPVFPPKITTLKGLADSDFKISMVDYGEFVPEALAKSKDSILHALGKKMDLFPLDLSNYSLAWVQCVEQRLLTGKFAMTDTFSYLLKTIKGHPKAGPISYFLRDQIYTGPLAFYFTKYTPWHKRFNENIQRLYESGIIIKWYKDLMENGEFSQQLTSNSVSEVPRALTITHLQGPFLMLLIGLGFSGLIFIVELALCGICKPETSFIKNSGRKPVERFVIYKRKTQKRLVRKNYEKKAIQSFFN